MKNEADVETQADGDFYYNDILPSQAARAVAPPLAPCYLRMRIVFCTRACMWSAMDSEKIHVLFEYAGSRRPLLVPRNGALCNAIERELEKFGCVEPCVQVSAVLHAPSGGRSFLLQRWSTTWNAFVDVESIDDVESQDRLTVVPAPSQEVNILL